MKPLKIAKWIMGMIFIIGLIQAFYILQKPVDTEINIVEMNRIVKEGEAHWEQLERLKEQSFAYSFVIFNMNGKPIFQYGDYAADSIYEATKEHLALLPITRKDKLLGTVSFDTSYTSQVMSLQRKLMWLIFIIFIVEGIGFLIVICYIQKSILKPFEKMKKFAGYIAGGDLDIPLEMDGNNVFGSFTESFDVMREELKKAKQQEYLANESKKELVATLSHDIKTPVTSIKLMSELLLAKIQDEQIKGKLQGIYNKAEQINSLITDMFHATLEELGELKVETKDEYATKLIEYLRSADYYNLMTLSELPECMICIDPLRMEQIIGNIINNSYKYANTAIEATACLKRGYLQLDIKDYGKGIAEEELPLIFNKFYRGKGKEIQEKSGAGLGLYISKFLMEKMGGEISSYNVEDGFVIRLLIPISTGN